jgi:hypothetical protein
MEQDLKEAVSTMWPVLHRNKARTFSHPSRGPDTQLNRFLRTRDGGPAAEINVDGRCYVVVWSLP